MAFAEISVFLVMIAVDRIERFVLFLDNVVERTPLVKGFVQNLVESGAKKRNKWILAQDLRYLRRPLQSLLKKRNKWILAQDLRYLKHSLRTILREGLLALCSVDMQVNNLHESPTRIKPEKLRKIWKE